MRIAYFDCFSGASGDMILAALVHAGLSQRWLRTEIKKLGLSGYVLHFSKQCDQGITGQRLRVRVTSKQASRSLKQIRRLIRNSPISTGAKERILTVFSGLARVEGRIHGIPPDKVHFHEVGAVDSIIDIAGTVLALEKLKISKVVVSAIPVGKGSMRCQHGVLPVPAPATAELLKGWPVRPLDVDAELMTPTAAALLKTLAQGCGVCPAMTLREVGYGLGHRKLPFPNFLRVMIGDRQKSPAGSEVLHVIQTQIDDMNPEIYGYVLEQLFAAGARDAYLTPVFMKKQRPGTLLTVLADGARVDPLCDILFSETTTLGVRIQTVLRRSLQRRTKKKATPYGPLVIKEAVDHKGIVRNRAPEFDSCRALAQKHRQPLKEIYRQAL